MSAGAPKSLVLVTVDCLRADHTGFMGYQRPTTPFLDELSAGSFVVPNAVAAGAPTYYSFPGIMASRFPLGLGREVVGIAPGEPTLATVLQESGYATAAFIAANPYLSKRFGYEQGFESFRDFLSEEMGASGKGRDGGERAPRNRGKLNQKIASVAYTLGARWIYDELYFQYCQRIATARSENWDSLRRYPAANVLVDEACKWLRSGEVRPFFLWLHFMDPHAPYYPCEEALQAMGAADLKPMGARYLNESWNRADLTAPRLGKYRADIVRLHDAGIRWVDTQLKRLVEELKSTGKWDSCAFVLTADHGEEFLDHGGRFHPPSNAYQEMLHVPLLLRVPGAERTKLPSAPFSLLHLAPTILDAMGLETPLEFEGRSFWRDLQAGDGPEWAISESVGRCTNPMQMEKRMGGRVLAVQDRKNKLVIDFENGTERLFDLEADRSERTVLQEKQDVRARLLRVALQHLKRRGCESKAALAIRARVWQIGLEWGHSVTESETMAT